VKNTEREGSYLKEGVERGGGVTTLVYKHKVVIDSTSFSLA